MYVKNDGSINCFLIIPNWYHRTYHPFYHRYEHKLFAEVHNTFKWRRSPAMYGISSSIADTR